MPIPERNAATPHAGRFLRGPGATSTSVRAQPAELPRAELGGGRRTGRPLAPTCAVFAVSFLTGAGFAWWWLVCYQPTFWVRAYERVSVNNHAKLAHFERQLARARGDIERGEPFEMVFVEDGVTTWCRRVVEGGYFRLMPRGMTWLLVAFRRDEFLFGFQDRTAAGWPVITMAVRPRLLDGGTVLFELSAIRRGRLAEPGDRLRHFVDDTWLTAGMRLEWLDSHDDSARFLLHMPPELVARGLCLTRFESSMNEISIAGQAPGSGVRDPSVVSSPQ